MISVYQISWQLGLDGIAGGDCHCDMWVFCNYVIEYRDFQQTA